MKKILIVIAVALLLSCSKNDDSEEQFLVDLGVNISLESTTGDDLLDPENPNSYKKSEIKTYHLIDEVEQRAGADDVLLQDPAGTYVFRTFVNYKGNDEYPITYIDWSETDRDTIKSEIYRTINQIRVIKVWYNGELMWDVENGGDASFTIIK